MQNAKYFILLLMVTICSACSTTRHVPDDQYLLNKVDIKSEGKGISPSEMSDFLRQHPNTSWPLLGRVKLRLYHIGWVRKLLPGLTEKPVFYSSRLTDISSKQIELEVANRGYLRAEVDTAIHLKGRKANVTYSIHPGSPYRIRMYRNNIADTTIRRITMRMKRNSVIKQGMLFDLAVLDEEKARFTQGLRNVGYYNFNKDYLYYKADTTTFSNQVDLALSLYPAHDSLPHKRYRIGSVTVVSGYDPLDDSNAEHFSQPDTIGFNKLRIVYGSNRFLRPSAIYKNNFIRPGRWYSERNVSATISSFSGIGAIKQANISFSDSLANDSAYLNARIVLSPANTNSFQAGLDGTNSAGDFGVAGNVSYHHQNLFNGAEVLGLKLRGAYEFVSGSKSYDFTSQNYYEYGVETSLLFPKIILPLVSARIKEQPMANTQLSVGLTNQRRPEYGRQFFNASLNYKWKSLSSRFTHSVDLLDINYVRMPWVSDLFRKNYLENDRYPLLRYSYEDQLISRLAYTNIFTGNRRQSSRTNFSLRTGIDIAGILPRLAGLIGATTQRTDGSRELLGIRYAEYAKLDVDFARADKLSESTSMAYHVAVGIAKPYGNSEILPFEKRYFSGGSNSVRGWSTRRLGPGFYHPKKDSVEFANQVGDIKLDLSVELRQKLSTYLQLALFLDAGNNWVIDNNGNTPQGGLFQFSEFYKQIALSYGMGIRFDLGFLLLRFDGGLKAFDPGQDADKRWRFSRLNFSDDFAFHFAIGYPF
jgi:outer membrane protein assembly factor BamA